MTASGVALSLLASPVTAAWMKVDLAGADLNDGLTADYGFAGMPEQVLKRCGADLTRDNIVKQAATPRRASSLFDARLCLAADARRRNRCRVRYFRIGRSRPASRINTAATDDRVVTYMQMRRLPARAGMK